MSRKLQALILANVALIAAIAWSILGWNATSSDAFSSEATRFALKDTIGIDRIEIGPHVLTLESRDNWQINGKYQVQERVIQTAFKILKGIEVKRKVSQGMKQELTEKLTQQGLAVKVKSQGKELLSYTVAPSGEQDALMQGSDGIPYLVYLPGYFVDLYRFFDIQVNEWRENRLLYTTPRTLQSITLTYPTAPANDLSIHWEGNPMSPTAFFVVDGVTALDTGRLWDYIVRYEQFAVTDFVTDRPGLKDSLEAIPPICSIELRDAITSRNNTLDIYPTRPKPFGISRKTNEVVEIDPRFVNARSRLSLLATRQFFMRQKP